MGQCFSFLQYEHEIGWEVEYQVAGINALDLMAKMQEPDQKNMNDVWRKVDMKGMHSVKLIQESIDGFRGGVGSVYENYDKKGIMQNTYKVTCYEVQDGGKSVYTEGIYIAKGPDFPFKLRDEDVQKMKLTTLDNGNCNVFMEMKAVMQMRGFSECCLPMMYPLAKFQKAIQEVIAPKGDVSKVARGKMWMKKDPQKYKLERQIPRRLSAEIYNDQDIMNIQGLVQRK